MSCECKSKFGGRKCNSNHGNCQCECKKYICEKDFICSPAACSCKNGKYLASVIDDSVMTCDEIIEVVQSKTLAT